MEFDISAIGADGAEGHADPGADPGAARPLLGRDHTGTLYFSSSLGWASRHADGSLLLNSEGAASAGITVRRAADGSLEITDA